MTRHRDSEHRPHRPDQQGRPGSSWVHPPPEMVDRVRRQIDVTVLRTWYARADGTRRTADAPGAIQWGELAVPLDDWSDRYFTATGVIPADLRPVVDGQHLVLRCSLGWSDALRPPGIRVHLARTPAGDERRERLRLASYRATDQTQYDYDGYML